MSHSPRYSELRQLVFGGNGLTPEEARYLRFLLYDIHIDLISDLPLELVILVALGLELDDFHRCLRVSKAWRQRFLSDSVMLAYANHRWPAMIEGVVTPSRFLEILLKLRRASPTYWIAEDKEVVRFDNTTHFTLDPVFHSQHSNVPDVYTRNSAEPNFKLHPVYAFGKVAWHIPGCAIVIDDLRSKTRKVFTPPSGTMRGLSLKLRSLGSRLAIGTIDRLLIAWDHVNNRAYEKSLPGRVLQCATQDSRVAIVLYGGDVITWTPGHAATHLDISCLFPELGTMVESWKKHLNVFFDPRNSKTLYLASCYHVGTRTVRVKVHEFSESVHVASWSSEHSNWYHTLGLPVDYEFNYSYILFRPKYGAVGSVFDKINRMFVNVDYCGRIYFDNQPDDHPDDYSDFSFNGDLDFQIDLDFIVLYDELHYEVLPLTLP
ncbi:hypothetical protein F4679DRAFT_520083 [Xylaria curta]|nr:hypothetical protein F4679DRAFT_520083 [Xylaria curta]